MHAHTFTRIHKHTQSHTHARTHTQSHAHAHTHAHKNTHTHTHTRFSQFSLITHPTPAVTHDPPQPLPSPSEPWTAQAQVSFFGLHVQRIWLGVCLLVGLCTTRNPTPPSAPKLRCTIYTTCTYTTYTTYT